MFSPGKDCREVSVDQLSLGDAGIATQLLEGISIVIATALILVHVVRISSAPFLWLTLIVVVVMLPLADLVSGIVHWAADTWGREDWPIVGQRFLRPFRVHHINPEDFLRRSFLDANGDVSMMCLPLLLGAFFIPTATEAGRLTAIAIVAFCLWTMPTNQIHQWAHMPDPPRWVRLLQRSGLILRANHHQGHHTAPFQTNYCIINGWCNRLLAWFKVFSRLETTISILTGLVPRCEEQATSRLERHYEVIGLDA